MRIGIDLSLLMKAFDNNSTYDDISDFFKKVKEQAKDCYIFYNVKDYSDNVSVYKNINNILRKIGIKPSDVVLYKKDDLDLILDKYNVDVLFSDHNDKSSVVPIFDFYTEIVREFYILMRLMLYLLLQN